MKDEAKNFHEETFQPVEDTPVETPDKDSATDSETDQPQENSPEETSQETNKVDEPDNWEVRAKHWQSEAYKRENAIKEREAELERLRREFESKKEPELQRPQRPKVSHEEDPTAWIVYSAEMAEYNAAVNEGERQRREAERQQVLQQQRALEQRNNVLGKLTEVTNNPEKSQKILDFFAHTENLNDPIVYNIMYDAVQEYKTKKPQAKKLKSPLPPTGGGKTETEKVSPDEAFNNQLGQTNRFKL